MFGGFLQVAVHGTGTVDAELPELIGEAVEYVVKAIANVSDGEAGLFADFAVLEVLEILEFDELTVVIAEFGHRQAQVASGFEMLDGVGWNVAAAVVGGFDAGGLVLAEHFALLSSDMIE